MAKITVRFDDETNALRVSVSATAAFGDEDRAVGTLDVRPDDGQALALRNALVSVLREYAPRAERQAEAHAMQAWLLQEAERTKQPQDPALGVIVNVGGEFGPAGTVADAPPPPRRWWQRRGDN